MKELNTSMSSEKRRKYFSTWIRKVQCICDGEILTSNLFHWEKKGRIIKLTDKLVDVEFHNALSTYFEHNSYKLIQHFYPCGVEVIRDLCSQYHVNTKEIKDKLY